MTRAGVLPGDQLVRELVAWFDDLSDQPFAWGQLDCNTLALGWLDRLTGSQELAQVLQQYSTEAEARAFQLGYGRTVLEVLEGAGAVVVPGGRAYAQPGDFILIEDKGEPWWRCHVCAGAYFASVWPGEGVRLVPLRELPQGAVVMRCKLCRP